MQYFYFLNNKDIYGINGRFFGSTLSVCDCVDYLKQIGVPEGTSMDLTFGGFNGCYVYANNTLIKTLPSCGYAPPTCVQPPQSDWSLGVCTVGHQCGPVPPFQVGVTFFTHTYIATSNALHSGSYPPGAGEIQYQMQFRSSSNVTMPPLDSNWNIPIETIVLPSDINSTPSFHKIFVDKQGYTSYPAGIIPQTAHIHARIRKLCFNGLYSPWGDIKYLTYLRTTPQSNGCPNGVCP